MKKFHCSLVWGQMKATYPNLSTLLVKIYRAPSSTGGIERNHKVGKRVLTQCRTRMNELNYQRQVAVAHNSHQIRRPNQ